MASFRYAPTMGPTTLNRNFKIVNLPPTPLVTVVIPNFNHARYIGDAIQSVLGQSYRHVEVIVVDDGSTDDSRLIAASFGQQIRYIWQENRGLSAARNRGIQAATGEYIGLLDADDLYEPDCLKTLLAILQANPDADGVYCGYQFVDQANQPLAQIEARLIQPTHLYDRLLDGNFFVPESVLVHRRCYTDVGAFDETLRACEDWDMWLRITQKYHIIGTNAVLTRHRVLAGSMSSDPTRMINNRLAVLDKHLEGSPCALSTARTHKAYGEAYLTSAIEYLQYGDEARAYECLRQGVNLYPALLLELPTFFELGCGAQPKGSRGDFAKLNLRRNAQVLMDLLNRLFQEKTVTPELQKVKDPIYALAYFALGLLCYGAGEFTNARRQLLRAFVHDPTLVSHEQFLGILARTCLGPRLINYWKKLRNQTKLINCLR